MQLPVFLQIWFIDCGVLDGSYVYQSVIDYVIWKVYSSFIIKVNIVNCVNCSYMHAEN